MKKELNLENRTEHGLTIPVVMCRLYDKIACEWIDYKGVAYTKLNSVYGYLSVDLMTVKFFWTDGDSVCCDDITDRFEIEYYS